MPDAIARKVGEWLDDEETKWELDRDVVEWLEPFGDDLDRAWSECASPPMMLAIAGAHAAPIDRVVPIMAELVREAVSTLPTSIALPREALVLVEQLDLRGPLVDATELGARFEALWDEVMQSVSRAELARQKAEIAALEAIAVVGLATPKTAPTDALALLSVAEWGRATARVRELVAQANAVRAASSALASASSASLTVHSAVVLSRVLARGSGADASLEGVADMIRIHRASTARVFSEAALAIDRAAATFGELDAASDVVWAASTPRVVAALLSSAERSPDAAEHGFHRSALHAAAQRGKHDRLASFAERLREALPASALRGSDEGAIEEGVPPKDPRAFLTRCLEPLAPLARVLGASDVTDVVEVALAILRAPGPLDKDGLAPVMRELHARVAGMFRLRAEEAEGGEREEALRALSNAEEAAAAMDEVLARIDPSAAN